MRGNRENGERLTGNKDRREDHPGIARGHGQKQERQRSQKMRGPIHINLGGDIVTCILIWCTQVSDISS